MREVDLVSYLPSFMQSYIEPVAAFEAENPEFDLIWMETDKVLKNRFISTADEYGISRFEKILNIFPSTEETLEERRAKVFARWNERLPYTLSRLRKVLEAIVGESGFRIDSSRLAEYWLGVTLVNQGDRTYHMVEELLMRWIPVNLLLFMQSYQVVRKETKICIGAGRYDYIRLTAMPEESEVSYLTSVGLEIGTGVVAYYQANYQPASV